MIQLLKRCLIILGLSFSLSAEQTDGAHQDTDMVMEYPFTAVTIYFDYDTYVLSNQSKDLLQKFAKEFYSKYPGKILKLEGHTDTLGSTDFKLALSDKFVRSVSEHLQNYGISSTDILTMAYGKACECYDGDITPNRVDLILRERHPECEHY